MKLIARAFIWERTNLNKNISRFWFSLVVFFNAFASNIIFCMVLLLDGADIRQQLGFNDHEYDSEFSDEEEIVGGK